MPILALDHVNVRTTDVERLVEWYERVVGLKRGPRPAFAFDGAWLYAGDQAVLHLVSVASEPPPAAPTSRLEHFSLRAAGLADFVARLRREGVEYMARRLVDPAAGVVQINIHDPDGNHLHVDFDLAEADGVEL